MTDDPGSTRDLAAANHVECASAGTADCNAALRVHTDAAGASAIDRHGSVVQSGAVDGDAAGRGDLAAAGDLERAAVDGGVADVGVGSGEGQGARAGLGQPAGTAANRSADGRVPRAGDRQKVRAVGHVAADGEQIRRVVGPSLIDSERKGIVEGDRARPAVHGQPARVVDGQGIPAVEGHGAGQNPAVKGQRIDREVLSQGH